MSTLLEIKNTIAHLHFVAMGLLINGLYHASCKRGRYKHYTIKDTHMAVYIL